MLAMIPALANVSGIVRAHHELFDGGGYPDGLAGNDIPLAARILAVADSFEAMIAERSYRARMTKTKPSRNCAAALGRNSIPASSTPSSSR